MAAPALPMDDRDGVIWLNGHLVPWRDAKVHVLVHSLHYGNSVFEGERIYGGKVFKLTEHSRRLHTSANMLAYELPYSVAELDAATRLVVAENKLDSGYVRAIDHYLPDALLVPSGHLLLQGVTERGGGTDRELRALARQVRA